jgi:hypothetical protein
MNYYVYYSYEEWGRGYIGSKPSGCVCAPEDDPYFGSFKDKTFKPTQKIILGVYGTPKECINAEVNLHAFFEVDINPHFANLARQTSTGFISLVKTKEHRENISKGLTGRKLSPESIAKRQAKRVYATGEDHHMVKNGHTEEARAKIKEARAKQENVVGGCSHPWWVKEDGTRTRARECPGEEWQRGMKWDPRGQRDGKYRRWVNKDGEQKRSPIHPGEGWQNGSVWKEP